MCNLSDRVALITGARRGIGRAIAMELARAGADVVIGDLPPDCGEPVAEEIRSIGRRALALPLDVTNVQSVQSFVENAHSHFSLIDILVNNAGIFQSHLGLELDDLAFNHCLDVNLTGMWRMTRAVMPYFKTIGRGRIVNVASVGGRLGVGFAPAYCASKAGVISLTQSLASALGRHNVNVNSICPGAVATPMQEHIGGLRDAAGTEDRTELPLPPLAGPLEPEDIGRAVVFLASDYAKSITGQALNVDCGAFMN